MALAPKPSQHAAWMDESVVRVPKNIYGATEVAAEDICELVQQHTEMPVFVVRTSRLFPEAADVEEMRDAVDIDDVVTAHDAFAKRRWKFLPRLDPVYDSSKTVQELFERALKSVEKAEEWRSELWITVGGMGYHKETTGVYYHCTQASVVPNNTHSRR
ncbi:hypothetical protein V1527DRAFT_455402 [Lipomyces starkeyi]